ncbi:hypothetical protein VTN49DRAFT_711 [Thermomyces lanuginosus]|uniref:uncharacterized protein n=1 Tax=Thermomyces lanuginosus TaxID=5541 RepID=UPI003743EA13
MAVTKGWLKDLSQTRASDSELFSPDTEIDPFTFSSDRHDVSSGETRLTALEAVNHVRDILDLATLDSTSADEPTNAGPQEKQQSSANISLSGPIVGYLKLPVFIGHGALDPKVSVRLGPEFQGPLTSLRLERETEKNTKAYADSLPVPDSVALGTAFITMDDLTLAGSSRTRHGSNVPRGGGYDIGSS